MKNKIAKSIGVLSLASLMTTTAHAQLTISGYAEAGFLTGSTKGTLQAVNSKGLGGETVITIAGKGKLSNGWEYSAYQNIDSDEAGNGRNTTFTRNGPLTTRAITLSPTPMISLFYTYDGVYGGEIARTAVPAVTERVADLTGNATISEFIDVTSGSHAVGFDINQLGPNGRLSVAYNPHLGSMPDNSSDRSYSGTLQTGYGAEPASGYSIGYSVSPGPVTLRVGMTKIDQKQSTSAKDAESRTAGVTFTQAPFAIGVQRTKNDGGKAAFTTTTSFEDEVDTVSASFAASKELTIGATYSTMERTGPAITTKGPDLKVTQLVVAYNLGPVVISGAYEDAKNRALSNAATTSGVDATTAKIKVKANF
jgi:hypothetical protein